MHCVVEFAHGGAFCFAIVRSHWCQMIHRDSIFCAGRLHLCKSELNGGSMSAESARQLRVRMGGKAGLRFSLSGVTRAIYLAAYSVETKIIVRINVSSGRRWVFLCTS